MCKSKKSSEAIAPARTHRSSSASLSSTTDHNTNINNLTNSSSSYSSSLSSSASLAGIKSSLPDNPIIYDFSEISAATGSFQKSRFSASSWRCSLRGKDAIVFQRKLRRGQLDAPEIPRRLASICRSHHSSLVKLLGASISGNYVYLVYEFVNGVNLGDCLRNPRNRSFTVLSTWISRMKIATDIAHGLDYVHQCSGLVHNHVKSSAIIIVDSASMDGGSINAKICHFGTCEVCGEAERDRAGKVEGTRGYMAPEMVTSTGVPTQKSDVYAFGVVLLELLSGKEPLKYLPSSEGEEYGRRVSVIDTARKALESGEVRLWIDRRVKDSFPEEVAENMVRVGLECTEEDPNRRPDMGRVALRVSKLYLDSQNWAHTFAMPTDISVSLAPR